MESYTVSVLLDVAEVGTIKGHANINSIGDYVTTILRKYPKANILTFKIEKLVQAEAPTKSYPLPRFK